MTGKFLLPILVLTGHGDRPDVEVHSTSPILCFRVFHDAVSFRDDKRASTRSGRSSRSRFSHVNASASPKPQGLSIIEETSTEGILGGMIGGM